MSGGVRCTAAKLVSDCSHIPQKYAKPINAFCEGVFNSWLNLHRPRPAVLRKTGWPFTLAGQALDRQVFAIPQAA